MERSFKEVLRISEAVLYKWILPDIQWPATVKAIQKVINQSPLKRLGKTSEGRTQYPMEIFTGLRPAPLLIPTTPLRKQRDMRAIHEVRIKEIANDLSALQEALEHVHKEVSGNNSANRSRARRVQNVKTKIVLLNIDLGGYVTVRTSAKPKDKLQSKWLGQMLVKQAKSNLVYLMEDIIDARKLTVHAQRMVPYPVTKAAEQLSEELKIQALHFDSDYHLVDEIVGTRKRKGEFEVLIKWSGFDNEVDRTSELLSIIQGDIPDVLEDFMHNSGDRSLKREALALHF